MVLRYAIEKEKPNITRHQILLAMLLVAHISKINLTLLKTLTNEVFFIFNQHYQFAIWPLWIMASLSVRYSPSCLETIRRNTVRRRRT
jgi:hypothetical protein